MFNKKTIRDIDVHSKRILVRVDFNVPVKNGIVGDDTRIRASLPTIKYLLDRKASVILCSHLGRPDGTPDLKYSLKPVAEVLGKLIGKPVLFAEDCIGEVAESKSKTLQPGEILLLENTRFHAGETKNDPGMAKQLANLAELFVNDAFGSAHRAHASTEGVARYLPAVAGFLMEKEIQYLGGVVTTPAKPLVAILGGAKISDKIGVIKNLLGKADTILIGGGMANTFFKAQGLAVGDSLVEDEVLQTAREFLELGGEKLLLPKDMIIADKIDETAQWKEIPYGPISNGWRIVDIGSKTVEEFSKVIQAARTVVWNGPMGINEIPAFAQGTYGIARSVAESKAVSVIGGGESVAAIQQSGLASKITHISTGGGASLEMLEGLSLPGVSILQDN